jgi:hypothetical protein
MPACAAVERPGDWVALLPEAGGVVCEAELSVVVSLEDAWAEVALEAEDAEVVVVCWTTTNCDAFASHRAKIWG